MDEVRVEELSEKQRLVLRTMERYRTEWKRSIRERDLAEYLGMHWTTVREHIRAIHRKGWLASPSPGPPTVRLE